MSEISIVVPVYKGIRFLREALDSVKAQTFTDWECLCVDDGSKDGSGALLDEIAATDPRIRVFHRENGGTSVARNFALSQAKGRYVAFLDEDDVYHPRFLETLRAAAERTGADVVGCERTKFDETSRPDFALSVPDETQWRVADRARLREWVCDYYNGVPFEVWRNLYRRETVADHVFRPGVRVEQDLLWHYTLLPRVGKYVRIPWNGYGWRMNSSGGYLHPDADSLVSLVESSREVVDAVRDGLGLSAPQAARFAQAMVVHLEQNVLEQIRGGVAMDACAARRLCRAFHGLRAHGVDLGTGLRGVRRLKWNLFMLTGSIRWVRDVSHREFDIISEQ